jgi:hypothetical protein
VACVEAPNGCLKVRRQRGLPWVIEGEKSLVHRPVIGPEELHKVVRRAVTEDEGAIGDGNRPGGGAERLLDPGLAAPLRGRTHAGRRRDMAAKGLEDLPNKTARGPIGQPDLAPTATHAHEFGGCLCLVWREHHAVRRNHCVERLVLEGKLLGIGDLVGDAQRLRLGAAASLIEQFVDVVR